MTKAIFRAMRDQMTPPAELVDSLTARLEAEADFDLQGPAQVAATELPPGQSATDVAVANGARLGNRPAPLGAADPARGRPEQGRPRQASRSGRNWHKSLAPLTGGVLAVGLAAVMGIQLTVSPQPTGGAPVVVPAPSRPAVAGIDSGGVPAEAYQPIYQQLASLFVDSYGTSYRGGGTFNSGVITTEGSAESAPMAGSAPVPAGSDTSVRDYNSTNTQVANIDEGDIVKTDGRTIYIATGTMVALFDAAGAETRQLAVIETDSPPADGSVHVPSQVLDLMLSGDRLAVLIHRYEPSEVPQAQSWDWAAVSYQAAETLALIYDISDPANPNYLSSVGQSGGYRTSRLVGDVLYLVSEYTVPGEPDADNPATFIPYVDTTEGRRLMAPGDITCLPVSNGPRYAVATATELATGQKLGEESVLGGADTIYLNESNLFLAGWDWNQGDDVITADRELSSGSATNLARIALDGGQLNLAAQATIDGNLINQFALDEFDSHLRLAVNRSGVTTDGTERWFNRVSLYVLDAGLQLTGSISSLVDDEQIQSVRFSGAAGYVVTFRQVDPLFGIDLSDPAAPVVTSALKIPGFSAYLHPYGDNRLLGLGYAGTDDGMITGLKLSMFDTSDPFNITELSSYELGYDESEATSNHHAVLIDAEHNLIGFDAWSWRKENPQLDYVVYGYDDQTGFHNRAQITVDGQTDIWNTTLRGLRIGNDLYLCSFQAVQVYSLDSFANIGGGTVE